MLSFSTVPYHTWGPYVNRWGLVFQIWQAYQAPYVELYYKMRYGPSWRWYYLNWEVNGEFLP